MRQIGPVTATGLKAEIGQNSPQFAVKPSAGSKPSVDFVVPKWSRHTGPASVGVV